MRCPHCHGEASKAPVIETHKYTSEVYRRRRCDWCDKTFVTVEQAPDGLRMPTRPRPDKKAATRPKQRMPSAGSAAHLQQFLTGFRP